MSEVKVNKISPRTNCGTVTLGDSGDSFVIPAGATITNNGTANGFGATGAVNWQTTVKTTGFTAVAGEGYFVDTSSGGFSVNLPAGTAGAVVGFKDYANTFDTGTLTLVQNGSDKIGGSTVNATLVTEGIAVTLVFIDSTKGWLVTDSGLQSEVPTAQYIAATGGTVTTVCTNFKVHTFTGPGTFCVSAVGNPAGSATVDYLVIGGGGGAGGSGAISGGGGYGSGGGGAGGYRESGGTASGCYTVSTAGSSPSPVAALPVAVQGYPITVGAGQPGGPTPAPSYPEQTGTSGVPSVFSTITSAGGGGGAGAQQPALAGGSGGGKSTGGGLGAGNTPPVSPPQGNDGGNTPTPTGNMGGGGGGGAIGAGGLGGGAPPQPSIGGTGGAAATSSINGTPTARAGGGGGGGGRDAPQCAAGGTATGGGGAGGSTGCAGSNGTANTGGGGGGSGGNPGKTGGTGGSGIVIIRYKFQG